MLRLNYYIKEFSFFFFYHRLHFCFIFFIIFIIIAARINRLLDT